MTFEHLTGHYTYRSYLNRETGAPDELLWAEADLFLRIEPDGNITGQLAFPAEANAPRREILDVFGEVNETADLELIFTATGRPDSQVAAFRYSYRCRPGHSWPLADPAQRLSLVGTVVRDEVHGEAKAGATASFVAVKRDFVEPRDLEAVALIPEAIDMLADPTHRLRHTVWHTVRGSWSAPALSEKGRQEIRALDWGIDDPPFTDEGRLDLENGAGEDFLYMHRRMILMLRDVYARAGKTPPEAWATPPDGLGPQIAYRGERDPATNLISYVIDPEKSGLMVPPATPDFMRLTGESDFLFFNKTARGFRINMAQLARRLQSSAFAATMPLGAYGNLIEFSVHNWMHMRWASTPRDPETGLPEVRPSFDISEKWSARHYDFLGDFHSSHVHPLFWRLHGWVDACIDVWFDAHEQLHPGQVTRQEVRGIPWFAPGTWVRKADPFDWPGAGQAHGHGGHGSHGGHNGPSDELATLKKVLAVLERELAPAAGPTAFVAPDLPGVARAILSMEQHGL